jgi:hypothetical protein
MKLRSVHEWCSTQLMKLNHLQREGQCQGVNQEPIIDSSHSQKEIHNRFHCQCLPGRLAKISATHSQVSLLRPSCHEGTTCHKGGQLIDSGQSQEVLITRPVDGRSHCQDSLPPVLDPGVNAGEILGGDASNSRSWLDWATVDAALLGLAWLLSFDPSYRKHTHSMFSSNIIFYLGGTGNSSSRHLNAFSYLWNIPF